MRTKQAWCLLVGGLLSSGVALAAQEEVGVSCRQTDTQPTTLEIEKQNSGDLVARISSYTLFNGQVPNARSIEVVLHLSNCQPGDADHWMGNNIYTCVGPDQPTVRDANGEVVQLPNAFKRLYFRTWMEVYPVRTWLNRFHYSLSLTLDGKTVADSDQFATDPGVVQAEPSNCRRRYSGGGSAERDTPLQ